MSNHTQLVKGFMGQTTSFDSALIKSNVLIMGSCELNGKHDIFMAKGKGMFTFTEGMIRRLSASGEAPTVLIYTLIPWLPINFK
jgi:hypothetical protein